MSSPRCAIYLRVSTAEQTVANQLADVQRLAKNRGYEIVAIFEETASAVASNRPVYETMKRAAHRGEFDVLAIWALDRLGRSVVQNIADVAALDAAGVQIVSVREAWLDTSGPTRQLLISIFSWIAQQEREHLIARTKAGMKRAHAQGRKAGRPPRVFDVEKARELRAQGVSFAKVAMTLRVPKAVVRRAIARVEMGSPKTDS